MTTVCTRAGLVPVCYGHNSLNVEGCLPTQGGNSISVQDLSVILCGNNSYKDCKELWGVFVAMKNHGGGEWGVMSNTAVNGKTYTSGPGHDYISSTKQSQYYALCGRNVINVMDKINTEVATLQTKIGKF